MSIIRDAEGNILNPPTPAVVAGKYSDERALDVDWFDLHPEDRSEVVHENPLYEDEYGNTWLYNQETKEWDIPVVASATEAAFADATASAEQVAAVSGTVELQTAVAPAIAPVVEPSIEVPPTEPTEIKENQNGTIDSNSSDKNVESHDSPESPRSDI